MIREDAGATIIEWPVLQEKKYRHHTREVCSNLSEHSRADNAGYIAPRHGGESITTQAVANLSEDLTELFYLAASLTPVPELPRDFKCKSNAGAIRR